MRRITPALPTLSLVTALVGCGGDAGSSADQSPDGTETGGPPTAESGPDETPGVPQAEDDGDRTAALKEFADGASWVDSLTTAVTTEPGRLEVSTTLIDPRGDSGSPEAQEAVAICESAVRLLEGEGEADPYVSVLEDDGTTWILYGHPAVPEGECGEI